MTECKRVFIVQENIKLNKHDEVNIQYVGKYLYNMSFKSENKVNKTTPSMEVVRNC